MTPHQRKHYVYNKQDYIAEYMKVPARKNFIQRLKGYLHAIKRTLFT